MATDFRQTIEAQAAGRVLRMARLYYMDFTSGPMWMWNGVGDLKTTSIDPDGGLSITETWMGTGDLLSGSDVDAAAGFIASKMAITLSGLRSTEADFIRSALQSVAEYKGRRIIAKIQHLADDWQPLDHAYAIWAGVMDNLVVDRALTSRALTLNCETPFVTRSRPRNLYFTDLDQQARSPGDRGLRFISAAAEKQIV
jgi:hypothetical protein